MSTIPEKSEFLQKIDTLVSQAIEDAIAINRKLGTPIYIIRDGKIVDISGEKIPPSLQD